GFHVYWLSHKDHKPILTTDCKPRFEFEIKADKNLSTLPPSRHRDHDPEFRYKNFGIDKLFISDGLYDKLIETLGECIKTKHQERKKSSNNTSTTQQTELNDNEIELISSAILAYYKKPRRHPLV